ncbi:Sorbitol dehydrogenase [Habropoda laboriosa]|uniref:Sorbitol dehydrogenase n=1 Tax=Habropoda laboriosa TaxID=597456 RepID=A0A0L7R9Z1_9HYME|nr:PREDICTED: D-arabinitol dehydrogenase 1-like [Habropoda laboriosa]XP_017787556.1 PREDICTED: D-arabinitol dehydrogenase 1-like [Habropoda laboriosa]KOC67685.1 Sorbitol dehydrogenase [Habropoda laboriosa]
MEFLSFDVKNLTLSLRKAEIPKPGPNDVRIKVAYCGICGTDLHILEGAFPCKKEGFLTLGHEFSGTVDAVGTSVKTVKVGEKVAVDPNSGCNTCNFCHSGTYQFCSAGGINSTIGIYKDGGFATHAIVPESQVHLIPDDVDLEQAALTEPLSCLAHGWDILDGVPVGSNVLITGAGIIGILWACLLHLHGLRKTVTVSEPQEPRRKLLSNLDLDYEIKAPDQLKEGFDVAIDCSGSGPAMEAAIPLLGRGGRLCVFGIANPKAKFCIEPFQIYMKELKIIGVNINPFTFPKGLGLLRAMAERYLNYEKLGIKVFSLSQYREALDSLKRGHISKAVFKM